MGDENSLAGTTRAHKHSALSSDGGFLETAVTGVTNLSLGSIVYGDASEIVTELNAGTTGDALIMGASVPEWGSGATPTWTLEGTDSSSSLVSALSVDVSDKSFYTVYYHVSCASGDTGSASVRINGVTSGYEWITNNQYATTPELHDSTSDSQILMHPEINNNTCYGTVNIFKSDANARETGITTSSLGGNTANGIGINYWSSGTGWTATTSAVSNITIFMSGGNCLGGMTVMSADF